MDKCNSLVYYLCFLKLLVTYVSCIKLISVHFYNESTDMLFWYYKMQCCFLLSKFVTFMYSWANLKMDLYPHCKLILDVEKVSKTSSSKALNVLTVSEEIGSKQYLVLTLQKTEPNTWNECIKVDPKSDKLWDGGGVSSWGNIFTECLKCIHCVKIIWCRFFIVQRVKVAVLSCPS